MIKFEMYGTFYLYKHFPGQNVTQMYEIHVDIFEISDINDFDRTIEFTAEIKLNWNDTRLTLSENKTYVKKSHDFSDCIWIPETRWHGFHSSRPYKVTFIDFVIN